MAVKGWGFTYKIDQAVPNEAGVSYKSVGLLTAVVKAHKTSGGGGASGKSVYEYGLSLQQIFDKFATDADKEKLALADTGSK